MELVNWKGKRGKKIHAVEHEASIISEIPLPMHEPISEPVLEFSLLAVKKKRRGGTKSGLFPIHAAAVVGDVWEVNRLLYQKANVDIRKGERKRQKKMKGLTPLHGRKITQLSFPRFPLTSYT